MKNLFASSRNGEENSVAQNEGRTMIHLEEFNKLREELEANNQSLKDALHKTEGEKHKVIVERKKLETELQQLKAEQEKQLLEKEQAVQKLENALQKNIENNQGDLVAFEELKAQNEALKKENVDIRAQVAWTNVKYLDTK